MPLSILSHQIYLISLISINSSTSCSSSRIRTNLLYNSSPHSTQRTSSFSATQDTKMAISQICPICPNVIAGSKTATTATKAKAKARSVTSPAPKAKATPRPKRQLTPPKPELTPQQKSARSFAYRVLAHFGLGAVEIDTTSFGNNSTTFVLTVIPSKFKHDASLQVNLAGTEPLPTLEADEEFKLVFSLNRVQPDQSAEMLCHNKVAANKLIRDAGGLAGRLAPKVYAWSAKTETEGEHGSWSLTQWLPGQSCAAR